MKFLKTNFSCGSKRTANQNTFVETRNPTIKKKNVIETPRIVKETHATLIEGILYLPVFFHWETRLHHSKTYSVKTWKTRQKANFELSFYFASEVKFKVFKASDFGSKILQFHKFRIKLLTT